MLKALDLLVKPLLRNPCWSSEGTNSGCERTRGREVPPHTFAGLIAPLNLFRGRLLNFSVPSVSSSGKWAGVLPTLKGCDNM